MKLEDTLGWLHSKDTVDDIKRAGQLAYTEYAGGDPLSPDIDMFTLFQIISLYVRFEYSSINRIHQSWIIYDKFYD